MSRASFQTRARVSKSAMIPSIIAKSPPAEKYSPAPVMMAAFTLGSASTSRQMVESSVCIAPSVAFSLPLAIVIRSTRGCGRSNRSDL